MGEAVERHRERAGLIEEVRALAADPVDVAEALEIRALMAQLAPLTARASPGTGAP